MYGYNDIKANTIKTRTDYKGDIIEYVTLHIGINHTHDLDLPLPHYADGGYPLVYYTSDSATLCGDCATQEVRANAEPEAIVTSNIIGADTLEGGAIDHGIVQCDNCNKYIVDIDPDDEWVCTDCGNIHDIMNDQFCQCGNSLQRQVAIDAGQLPLPI